MRDGGSGMFQHHRNAAKAAAATELMQHHSGNSSKCADLQGTTTQPKIEPSVSEARMFIAMTLPMLKTKCICRSCKGAARLPEQKAKDEQQRRY